MPHRKALVLNGFHFLVFFVYFAYFQLGIAYLLNFTDAEALTNQAGAWTWGLLWQIGLCLGSLGCMAALYVRSLASKRLSVSLHFTALRIDIMSSFMLGIEVLVYFLSLVIQYGSGPLATEIIFCNIALGHFAHAGYCGYKYVEMTRAQRNPHPASSVPLGEPHAEDQ